MSALHLDEILSLVLQKLPSFGALRVAVEVGARWHAAGAALAPKWRAQLRRRELAGRGPLVGVLPPVHRYYLRSPALLLWAGERFPLFAFLAGRLLDEGEWREDGLSEKPGLSGDAAPESPGSVFGLCLAPRDVELVAWVLAERWGRHSDTGLTLAEARSLAARFQKARPRYLADKRHRDKLSYTYTRAVHVYVELLAEIREGRPAPPAILPAAQNFRLDAR